MPSDNTVDTGFLTRLANAGVLQAARQIGLDDRQFLLPLVSSLDHNYRSYTWSTTTEADGSLAIEAVPAPEELGYTPWERWYSAAPGRAARESWVRSTDGDWTDIADHDPRPQALLDGKRLMQRLRDLRIEAAATQLGITVDDIFPTVTSEDDTLYSSFRWAAVPHRLAGFGPVIYAIPPLHLAHRLPWETWYRPDGGPTVAHHVHYTAPTERTVETWREGAGVGGTQRPPEIGNREWYWYDDPELPAAHLHRQSV